MPLETAIRHTVLPLAVREEVDARRVLEVLTPHANNAVVIKELAFVTGCEIVAEEEHAPHLDQAIRAAYLGSAEQVSAAAAFAARTAAPASHPGPDDAAARLPIPQLLTALLERALSTDASDIHIEPYSERVRVRYRIDGLLQEDSELALPREIAAQLGRRIRVLAKIDTTAAALPGEGGFSFASGAQRIRVRVSAIPQIDGEKIVLRLLGLDVLARRSGGGSAFASLGLLADQEACLRAHLGADHGCILLAGPTGSGKSTLLYAALDVLNTGWRNIITIEDPVERRIPGVNQVQTNREKNLGFSELLPPLLRQDPDVIMVGEIRDAPTAQTALTAAITGHLVLSTVHATNAIEVITRLDQLQAEKRLIASAVRLIIAQRLVPMNCSACRGAAEEIDGLGALFRFSETEQRRLMSSTGCPECSGSGISGRLGVFELLPITDQLRQQIAGRTDREGAAPLALRETAFRSGYRPLGHAVRTALLEGLISPAMALRALGLSADVLS